MNKINDFKIFFGTWNIPEKLIDECVKSVIESGFKIIDTATIYGNEKEVGEAVLKYNKIYNKNIAIQSKLWCTDFSNPKPAFERALSNLKTDKIFSYMLHRPTIDFNESITAWKFLVEMKKENKIQHLGLSNFDKDMIEILHDETGVYPEFNQIEMSVHNFRDDRVSYCKSKNILIQAYSPLAKDVLKDEVIKKLSIKHDCTMAQIALSFVLSQNFQLISKSTHKERMQENIKAFDINLSKEEILELKQQNTYDNYCPETFAML